MKWHYALPLQKAKRFIVASLVCSVALFPILGYLQLSGSLIINKRQEALIVLPRMEQREQDSKGKPRLFNEPIVSVTFDDGRSSIYYNAAPMLNKYGVKSTQYLLSGVFNDLGYVPKDQIRALSASGHDIACHSVSHQDLTTLGANLLNKELSGCRRDLSEFAEIKDFASPYSHTNETVISSIKSLYRSQRNTYGDITNGINEYDVNLATNFNSYNIVSVAIGKDTSIKHMQEAVDYVIAHNGWLVFTYHQIEDGNTAKYGLDPDSLYNQLELLSKSPLRIATIREVLDSFTEDIQLGAY